MEEKGKQYHCFFFVLGIYGVTTTFGSIDSPFFLPFFSAFSSSASVHSHAWHDFHF